MRSIIMLTPVGVAFDAVLEVEDTLLTMLGGDSGGIMLVAAVTGVGSQAVRVTKRALIIRAFVIHGEGVFTIIGSRFPCAGRVTGGAFGAELTKMFGRFGVASHTFLWRSFIHAILMAGFAFHVCVRAIQFESGEVVIERGWRPAIGRVTSLTLRAVGKLMRIIRTVTGVAIL